MGRKKFIAVSVLRMLKDRITNFADGFGLKIANSCYKKDDKNRINVRFWVKRKFGEKIK